MGHWTVVRPHCNVCLRARRAVPSVVVDIKVGDKGEGRVWSVYAFTNQCCHNFFSTKCALRCPYV